MHDVSDKFLLQIHPQSPKSETPVEDDLTAKMVRLLSSATKGTYWRGEHNCTSCGERSGFVDLLVGGYITNSLAAHYLRWHRQDVPASEITKLQGI